MSVSFHGRIACLFTDPGILLCYLLSFDLPGSTTLIVSNALAPKAAAPSYKKIMRVNQGQFKPGTNRNLSWQKPVSSDNLVITFSDDDSGTDSGKTKQDKVRKANSQGTQRTGNVMQTRITREEVSQQKTLGAKVGPTHLPTFPFTHRNIGAGRGSGNTFFRKEPPVRQVNPLKSKQKDQNGVGVHSEDHRLEILRHKIAARENELKGQKRPFSAIAMKNADFSSNQPRLPSEKIGLEASNSGEYSHVNGLSEHDGGLNKRLKLNQQHSFNQFRSDLVTLAPIGSTSGKNNVISSEATNQFENGITMDLDVDETDPTVTTELAHKIQHCGATQNLPHRKDTGGAGKSHVELAERPPFTDTRTIPEDTGALAPVASAQVRQQVLPVGTSPVLDGTPQLQPGKEVSSVLFCSSTFSCLIVHLIS